MEREREQLRLQKTGNVAFSENCQRGIQQIAAHAHRSKFAYTSISWLMLCYVESSIISIGVFTQQIDGRRTKCVSNCNAVLPRADCKLFSIVDTVQTNRELTSSAFVPRYSDHAACSKIFRGNRQRANANK